MTDIAIACQGGGSHTAFTAGVLRELLPWLDDSDHRLVGLSGTSGGALSAVAGWYGLQTGGGPAAVETIDSLWADVAVDTPTDRWLNESLVWGARARAAGLPMPDVSPYRIPGQGRARERFLDLLRRHVDFETLADLAGPPAPKLIVGTVNVTAGEFETFEDDGVTAEAVLASAAVPELFEAVELHGHLHWDGLFSLNPPIHELMDVDAERKPEELWVVQINPKERDREPRALDEIRDRRNELSANISLHQSLQFIERVNDWVRAGELSDDDYQVVEVRRLTLDRDLDLATKLDRSPAFLESLIDTGRSTAREFLETVGPELE